MSLLGELTEKFQELPLNKQQEVLDFVEFLIQKNTLKETVTESRDASFNIPAQIPDPVAVKLSEPATPILPIKEAKHLALEEALMLSEANSVEWNLYKGKKMEVTVEEIEKRITYLEKKLKTKYKKYQEVLVPYLKDELGKRKKE